MQIELENLAWDRKELQEHLQTAIKEQKMMELILAELEEEHDKAIAKIELLASEVKILSSSCMQPEWWSNDPNFQIFRSHSTFIHKMSRKGNHEDVTIWFGSLDCVKGWVHMKSLLVLIKSDPS